MMIRIGEHPSALVALLTIILLEYCRGEKGVAADGNLRIAFQWKQIDYHWPSDDIKRLFPNYKQKDNLPLGLEVTDERIFLTVPRWRLGVAASLAYIHANDTHQSPGLLPYPSWEAHQYGAAGVPEIVSTFRVRADRCERLWVLDTGLTDILGSPEQQSPPALIVYDLTTDRMLRRYIVPSEQRTTDSLFANIVVEDYNCDDSYAYLADLGGPGLVVYSWKRDTSWLIKHHFFHPDPQGGEFNVSGIAFQWTDGLFGMALAPTGQGYSTLYFHPLSSNMEFSVSTELLRDPDRLVLPGTFHQFRALGSREANGQSSVSFFDPTNGVLLYALTNMNSLACWRPTTHFNLEQQAVLYVDNVTMVFPNDLKVDPNGNVWVLSDRLPTFMYSHLNPNEYNFRIMTGSVAELIRNTVCSLGGNSADFPLSTGRAHEAEATATSTTLQPKHRNLMIAAASSILSGTGSLTVSLCAFSLVRFII